MEDLDAFIDVPNPVESSTIGEEKHIRPKKPLWISELEKDIGDSDPESTTHKNEKKDDTADVKWKRLTKEMRHKQKTGKALWISELEKNLGDSDSEYTARKEEQKNNRTSVRGKIPKKEMIHRQKTGRPLRNRELGDDHHVDSDSKAVSSEDEGPKPILYPGRAPVDYKLVEKYERPGKMAKGPSLHDMGVRTDFFQKEKDYKFANEISARTERLLTEQSGFLEADEGEHTSEITQTEIARQADVNSATKYFELNLNQFGPYRMNYTRNGRHLLLGGAKGHIAAFDWQTKQLMCEMNVMETCHDVKWLHIETMFAVAQKKWTYIYDNQGVELHCLKHHDEVLRMEFLPYHFLLVGANAKGFITWTDTSIGRSVASHLVGGRLDVMAQNPRNALIHVATHRGTVALWSPSVSKPLVKIQCHIGGVRSIAVDSTGNYMATSGFDRTVKIWDLREYRQLSRCKIGHGAASLSFSQKGLLSAALGNIVEVYRDPRQEPISDVYLRHRCQRPVGCVQFCPYEDVLGVGHSQGFTSLLVPGAGEANFDALEANLYQTKKQRQNAEVKMLLEKIQPEMITLDTSILGKVNEKSAYEVFKRDKEAYMVKPRRIEFPEKNSKDYKKARKTFASKRASRDASLRAKVVDRVHKRQQKNDKKAKTKAIKAGEEYKRVLSRFKKVKE